MGKSKGIITGALVVTLAVGALNSIYKTDKLPNFRFFFGTGILFLILSLLADFEEEIAKALALAIMVFTLLGEGGGVLDKFLGADAASKPGGPLNNNHKNLNFGGLPPLTKTPPQQVTTATVTRPNIGLPTVVSKKELTPVKPIIPNGIVNTVFPG